MKRIFAVIIAIGTGLLFGTQIVSAHHISAGPIVSCSQGTVSVTVASWSGNVEIVKKPSGPTTEIPVTNPNSTVTVLLATIGGNGNYTAGRQNNPTDPVPVVFTVNCVEPTPSPSPTPSPISTPTPTPKPTSTPTSEPTPVPTAIPTPSPVTTPTPLPTNTPTATTPVVVPVPGTGGAG